MYQDKPTGGAVFIDGLNTILLNENELVEIRKAKIGFIFQQFNLIHTLDVLLCVHL
ncbi:lipoprotein-releasing system ATP-binding protein LolD, partial [Methanosarcinales archaeon]